MLFDISLETIKHSQYFYPIVFFSQILANFGLGIPVPDELLLMFAGFMWSYSYPGLLFLGFIMAVGLFIGDYLVFSIGKKAGSSISKIRFMKKYYKRSDTEKNKKKIDPENPFIVFIIRFMFIGMRPLGFGLLGATEYRKKKFIFNSIISTTAFCTIWMGIGFVFKDSFDRVLMTTGHVRTISLYIVLITIGGLVGYKYILKRKS